MFFLITFGTVVIENLEEEQWCTVSNEQLSSNQELVAEPCFWHQMILIEVWRQIPLSRWCHRWSSVGKIFGHIFRSHLLWNLNYNLVECVLQLHYLLICFQLKLFYYMLWKPM